MRPLLETIALAWMVTLVFMVMLLMAGCVPGDAGPTATRLTCTDYPTGSSERSRCE